MKRPPDLSRSAFNAALARNGFKKVLMWLEDTTGAAPGVSYGLVLYASGPNKGKVARRASLARAIRARDADVKAKGRAAA